MTDSTPATAARQRLRMWKERGRPLWPWIIDIAVGAAITALLVWLVPHVV